MAMNEDVRELLRSMARRRTSSNNRSRYDTSDVVQESLIQVWQQGKASLCDNSEGSQVDWEARKNWLWKVSRGHAAKLHRFHHANCRTVNQELPVNESDLASGHDPSVQLEHEEQKQDLFDGLRELASLERQIVMLYFFEGKSLAVVALETDTTKDVVRGILFRSLRFLCRKLKNR